MRGQRNNTIDILRLVLAILVVSIHTMALYSFSEEGWVLTSLGIARMAVPFFFIVSGYFFYNKIKNSEVTNLYLKRLLLFYITWVIIEIVTLSPMILQFIKENPKGTLIQILVVGATGSLWYISSMLLALVTIRPLLKRDKFVILFIISIVLFIIGLSGDSYYNLVNKTIFGVVADKYTSIFGMANIGFTCSVPFIVIGAFINKYNLKDKVKFSGVASILGVVLLVIEALVLYYNKIPKDYNMYISLLILVPAIFIWALNNNFNISDKTRNICREYSIGIYCTHQILMLYSYVLIGNILTSTISKFVVTLALATLVTFLLTKFKITRKYLLMSN